MSLRVRPRVRVSDYRAIPLDGQVCRVNPQAAGDPVMIHHGTVDLIRYPGLPSLMDLYMSNPEIARLVQQDVPDYCVGVVFGSGAGRCL